MTIRTTPPIPPIPTKEVKLRWTGNEMEYQGGVAGGDTVLMDGKSLKAPGPMDSLLLSLAGCMAVDVQVILERSRVPLEGLEVDVVGERAPEHPKRYTKIRLAYTLKGPGPEHDAKVQRAVDLSREKFCSVLHSLRTDIELAIEIRRT